MCAIDHSVIANPETARTAEAIMIPKSIEATARPRLLISMSGGGFLWQSRNVSVALQNHFDLHYVTAGHRTLLDRDLPDGTWHKLNANATSFSSHYLLDIWRSLAQIRETYKVIKEVDPAAIVVIATSVAIPLAVSARLLGKPFVFIESITRVNAPSITGRVLGALRLCSRFYVQWPEAVPLYSRAVYKGNLL